MTLTFLGQAYETTPIELAPIASKLAGKYRGVPVKFSHTQTSTHSDVTLTYRGIRYNR